METAVKERLVGAVVLVGLIVALVPEMLSGPRREATPARPSADGTVRTYTIDLAPPASSSPSVSVNAVEPAPEPVAAPPEPATQAPRAGAQPESKPVAQQSKPASRPALETGWVVQLGSFASRENAERLAAEVRKGGYRAFVSRFESGRRVRYRVRVGPEQDRAQAEAVARRLQRDGRQVSIVSHP